jgi:hypothetical protein
VTGVQTCALPIWPCFALLEEALFSLDGAEGGQPSDPAARIFSPSSSQIFEMRDIAFKAEARSNFKVRDLISAIEGKTE